MLNFWHRHVFRCVGKEESTKNSTNARCLRVEILHLFTPVKRNVSKYECCPEFYMDVSDCNISTVVMCLGVSVKRKALNSLPVPHVQAYL